MRTKVIVNPDTNPRAVRRKLEPAMDILRSGGLDLSVQFTRGPMEALFIARQAVEDGFANIVCVSGDGTINEAVNGMAGSDAVLGVLPIGGSNVLARELGLGLDVFEAARIIAAGHTRRIDLGRINGRYFCLMASCGYDAHTVMKTNLKVKKVLRRYAYIIAGLKDFIGYRPSNISVDIDDGTIRETGSFAAVSNTHYYGGSHQLAPFAEVDDGYLDVILYKGKKQVDLVKFAIGVVSRQHTNLNDVLYCRAQKVSIVSDRKTPVQADGDLLGFLPMNATVMPDALKVFA